MTTESRKTHPQASFGQKARKYNVPQKSILSNKQTGLLKIIYQGEDLTPEPLNPLVLEGTKEQKHSAYSMTGADPNQSPADGNVFQSQSVSRFHTELQKQTIQAESILRQTLVSSSFIDDFAIEPEKPPTPSPSIIDEDKEFPNFPPGEDRQPKPMSSHISVILSETPTIWLIDIPSKTVEKNTEEATAVEEENERYDYLTIGKGRNRKMVNAEVQTTQILLKSRTTEAERVRRKHNHAFASNWEMYDTYEIHDQIQVDPVRQFIEDELDKEEKSQQATETSTLSPQESQMLKLLQNTKFLEAVCVIERLLANNNFNEEQKRFRGLSDPDPFREDIDYKYRLSLLWTFANKDTQGRCVSAMCWNEANPDILAVGYGKFYYTEKSTGMVMLWNVKNPVQPERTYRFEHPVTALNFSKQNPNVLGVGFYNGAVKLLDVSSRDLRVIGRNGKDSPSFEAIWQIMWFQGSDYFKNEEQIITTSEDGRVSHYRTQDTVELIYSQIMRIPRPEGKLKGVQTLRRCHVPGIPVTRYSPALVIQQHPADPNIYYVGTSEGVIHKCSRNYYHQHLDLFLAHDGPLYIMKFSPFCDKLLMTCGDDWNVRIWAYDIVEPLFELSKSMNSVQGADWSPTHSTIVANICGTDICIWDLQRKTYLPQSVTISPTNCRNTVIQFTASGRCLVVGDIEGNVNVFALEDMPFPAFFQDDLLANSIARNLITRPDLIRKLKKLGKLSFDKTSSQKYFTK